MSDYSISQWIIFFFCYAFIGWIWECFYVSVKRFRKNKKWKFINRGFLRGPVIPIYGFVAVSILITTVPICENTLALFGIGALTATIVELFTGYVMEKLFQIKYWDYSAFPLNYKGYICLFATIFWGFLSVLLVKFLHVPIAYTLEKFSPAICEVVSVLMLIVFTYDATVSFNEAMELKDILETLAENSETIRRIERRISAIAAFTPVLDIDDIKDITCNIHGKMQDRVERLRCRNADRIQRIKEHIQLPEFDGLLEKDEWLRKLERSHIKILEKSDKQYTHALNQLKRNPMMKSEKYQKFIKMLNEWNKN